MNCTGGVMTVCPFYLREKTKKIMCEGCADSAEIGIFFSAEESKNAWQERYCYDMKGFHYCPVARMLFTKY